jgi:ribonuclease D
MDHRARHHQSAHADNDAENSGGGQGPQGPPPALIQTSGELEELLQEIRAAGTFAYDSEFIGELSYVPKLCLIQVAVGQRVALIDPLVGLDLMPFWLVICDAKIEKIVHAGQQDLEPVFRHTGSAPANIFDTQIAAGLAGTPYPLSLSKLVGDVAGVKLGKHLTFTRWDQRPLSEMQLNYAADDVRYLPAVRAELGRRLDAKGHTAWAAEASAELCSPDLYTFDPEDFYRKIRGSERLSTRGLAVLRELTRWRNDAARTADIPPRTCVQDEVLLALARWPAKTEEELSRVRGLPRPVRTEHGSSIIAVTQRAMAMPDSDLPAHNHADPPPREKFLCDALWAAAQSWCFDQSIDPNLVASRQEVCDLRRRLLAGETTQAVRLMQGWRHAALGKHCAEMINGGQQGVLGER